MGFSTEDGTYVGKKRVAHNKPPASAAAAVSTTKPTSGSSGVGVPKKSLKAAEKVVRPKLVMEVGGKVQNNVSLFLLNESVCTQGTHARTLKWLIQWNLSISNSQGTKNFVREKQK